MKDADRDVETQAVGDPYARTVHGEEPTGISPTVTGQSERARSIAAPRDEIERTLLAVWQELLEQPEIGIREDFFELGGDSIIGARLMSALEKKYNRRLDLSLLFSHSTIESLAQRLRDTTEADTKHIVPMRQGGTRAPLFCFHCATGHVLRYRALASLLDPDLPVYGLRSPEIRGFKRLPTVEDLAELYVADIRKIQPHGPYQFCGFSFGGAVAFEAARQLRALGEPVSLLALLDTFNPGYYQDLPFLKVLQFRSIYFYDRLSKYARRFVLGEWRDFYAGLRDLVSWRTKELLWRFWRKESQVPKQVGAEKIEDTIVMFATIGWAFKPQTYPGRIDLIRAKGRAPEFGNSKTLGWNKVAQGRVTVHYVQGDHFSMLEQPDVRALAGALSACLERSTP